METVTLNDEKFDIELSLGRLSEDMEYLEEKDQLVLPWDFINNVEYSLDLYSPFPVLDFTFKDTDNRIINRFKANGEYGVSFYFRNHVNVAGKNEFTHLFVIDDISLVDFSNQEAIFKIKAQSKYRPIFNLSTKWYSTESDNPLPATQIIENILDGSGLPFVFNGEMVHSSNKFDYITPVNWTIKSNTDYLMGRAVDETNGIYMLNYNLNEDQLKVISIAQEFDTNKNKKFNATKMPTKFGFPEGLESYANNVMQNNFITGKGMIEHTKPIDLNYFDYKTREWKKEEKNFDKYSKYLPSSPDLISPMRNLYRKSSTWYEQNGNFKTEFHNNFSYYGKKFITLFQLMNCVQVTVFGFVQRNTGDLFTIMVDNQSSVDYHRFFGKWLISRIIGKITKNRFTQDLSLIRSEEMDTSTMSSESFS
ncbi:MAG TPA: hypothetical protein PLA71_00605 [Saccharofermentans sp.]|mgnify:CR=1 FL=1|nr:hypothetical protein [Saccharofermentans sp.]